MTEILYALVAIALITGVGLVFYKLSELAFLRIEEWIILRTGKATIFDDLLPPGLAP